MKNRNSLLALALIFCLFIGISVSVAEEINLAGSLSGIIPAGIYNITGDIYVERDSTLVIEPGAVFLFNGYYGFYVEGYLSAIGNESDSIKFQPKIGGDCWKGIDFINSYLDSSLFDSSTLKYCLVTGSDSIGVLCFYTSPAIENCTISNNSALTDGGGIKCLMSNSIINNCIISGNSTLYDGGGIFCGWSNLLVENTVISGNTADEEYGDGGGIYIYYSNPTIKNCTISGNSSNWSGGGIASFIVSNPTIKNCTISENSALWGGGICSYLNPTIINSIISDNTGGGIYFSLASSALVSFSDFHNNDSSNFTGYAPYYLGNITTVNGNGLPCDSHFNIFLNPLFVNAANGDYHLQSGSPCIDAGDPSSPLDPDSTIADMGAFFYDQTNVVVNPPQLPTQFFFLTNYPNPFNASTNIVFNLPINGSTSLAIYNVAGEQITILVDDAYLSVGEHQIRFDGSMLSSGIYFAQLKTANICKTQKLLLLK